MRRDADSFRERKDLARSLAAVARQAARLAGESLIEAHERARALHADAADLHKRHAHELAARGRLHEARAAARSSLKEKRWAEDEAQAADSARVRLARTGPPAPPPE